MDTLPVLDGAESIQSAACAGIGPEQGMRNAWLRSCVMASNAPAPNGLLDLSSQLRDGIVAAEPEPVLSGAVECDEVYIVAGHKGNPEAVKEKGRLGRCRRLKGAGEGEATNSGHPSARRCGSGTDAGECPTADHQAIDSSLCRTGDDGLHG